jgi:hypothetical protein
MRVFFALLLLLFASLARAGDNNELAMLGAWTSMPGAGRIGRTDAHLGLEPRFGGGVGISARLSDHTSMTLGGSMALLPVLLRRPGERDHGRVIRVECLE